MITPRPVRTSCSPRHDSWTGRLKCLSACERINKLWYTLSSPNKGNKLLNADRDTEEPHTSRCAKGWEPGSGCTRQIPTS